MATTVGYNYLGRSGIKVSNVCFGTMTFGADDGPLECEESLCHRLLDRFVELGGNFIDTADIYKRGKSEEILGQWVSKQERKKLVIATKVRAQMDPDDPNSYGLSRLHIMHAIDESLRRLQTDYVDLYQIHAWDDGTPIEETLSAMNDLVHMGKVRYIGASNVTGWQLQKIVETNKRNGWVPWITLQQQYSLLCRETEFELIDVCRNEGIGILPWSPLKGGWLSGKYKKGMSVLPEGARVTWTSAKEGRRLQSFSDFKQFNNDKVWNLLEQMGSIARDHKKTVSQVALKWLIQKDTVDSVIFGAKTMEQLEDNMGAGTDWSLTDSQMATLDNASAVEIPYPYEMVWRVNKNRWRSKPV